MITWFLLGIIVEGLLLIALPATVSRRRYNFLRPGWIAAILCTPLALLVVGFAFTVPTLMWMGMGATLVGPPFVLGSLSVKGPEE